MIRGKLESVCCDLCGADDAQPVIELRDRMFGTTSSVFQLVRCRNCGLHYLNPRPTIDEIGGYYPEDYAPFARNGIAARVKELSVDRDVKLLWHYLAPPARVIDVGCATGDLLQAVRAHGNPNVLGIEPSAHAANGARQRWGIDVLNNTLERASLPDDSVDVAILSHTIEHLPSPSTTLSELRRVVAPSGALVLWLPNVESFAARLLEEWWIGYDAPRHFYGFTPDTLTQLLRLHGFQVHSITHEWIALEWSWALRLIARDRISNARLDKMLATLHPALTLALTPVSAAAALMHRAGRIRVVAINQK